VRVPFPHVERPVVVPRPAIVVTPKPIGPDGMLIWAAMITNAAREDWPDDVPIPNAEALGLLIPSKVRTAKLFTAEAATSTLIGHLEAEVWARVRDTVRRHLGF